MQIEPFTPDHLDEAAGLLHASRGPLQETHPALYERYATVDRALSAISIEIDDGATGLAALDAGGMQAFLLAITDDNDVRGRFAWSSPDCFAYRDDVDALRNLTPRWRRRGSRRGGISTSCNVLRTIQSCSTPG